MPRIDKLAAMDAHQLDMPTELTSMRITECIDWKALQSLSGTTRLFCPLKKRVNPTLLSKLMADATRATRFTVAIYLQTQQDPGRFVVSISI